jgi:hypothetical protein
MGEWNEASIPCQKFFFSRGNFSIEALRISEFRNSARQIGQRSPPGRIYNNESMLVINVSICRKKVFKIVVEHSITMTARVNWIILTLVDVRCGLRNPKDCKKTTSGYAKLQPLYKHRYRGNTTITMVAEFVLCEHLETVVQVFRKHVFTQSHKVVSFTVKGMVMGVTCGITSGSIWKEKNIMIIKATQIFIVTVLD